jgi:hypothetical protein
MIVAISAIAEILAGRLSRSGGRFANAGWVVSSFQISAPISGVINEAAAWTRMKDTPIQNAARQDHCGRSPIPSSYLPPALRARAAHVAGEVVAAFCAKPLPPAPFSLVPTHRARQPYGNHRQADNQQNILNRRVMRCTQRPYERTEKYNGCARYYRMVGKRRKPRKRATGHSLILPRCARGAEGAAHAGDEKHARLVALVTRKKGGCFRRHGSDIVARELLLARAKARPASTV